MNFNFDIQSHLFVGSHEILRTYVNNLLQNIFCKNKDCRLCNTCIQIKNKNYSKLLWLQPDRQYNLEQIDIILQKTSLKLDIDNYFFIIIEHAELLTVACSNRLLKLIEEPPRGYYFIFLTNQPKIILPTIYSRCVLKYFENQNSVNYENELKIKIQASEVGKFFIEIDLDPNNFLKSIDKSNINEFETVEVLNLLISYWHQKYKSLLIKNSKEEIHFVSILLTTLNKSLEMLPMPGSSKIFWRNLYINSMIQN